jgi:ATP synthase F1 gamma subunit
VQATTFLEDSFSAYLSSLCRLDLGGTRHPFLMDREQLPSCTVVITTDEGFSGDLNTLLINAALTARDVAGGGPLVVLGSRGASALTELNESFVAFPGVSEDIDRTHVTRLQRYVVKGYLSGTFGRVLIVYAKFVSVTSQHVEEELLLPSRALFGTKAIQRDAGFIEPSVDEVVEGLVNLWLSVTIAGIFVSSKLAECAARVMHLEASDQELSRMSHSLARQYVKHLHELADTSIREISTSRLKVGNG